MEVLIDNNNNNHLATTHRHTYYTPTFAGALFTEQLEGATFEAEVELCEHRIPLQQRVVVRRVD